MEISTRRWGWPKGISSEHTDRTCRRMRLRRTAFPNFFRIEMSVRSISEVPIRTWTQRPRKIWPCCRIFAISLRMRRLGVPITHLHINAIAACDPFGAVDSAHGDHRENSCERENRVYFCACDYVVETCVSSNYSVSTKISIIYIDKEFGI